MNKRTSTFPALVGFYAILMAVWFVLWLTVGDGNWWLTLLNRFISYLFIPVPVFLVWGLFRRRYKALLPLLLPIFLFVGTYHPFVTPKWGTVTNTEPALKVMTYNVLYSNLDYDAVANVVLTYKPDLVAMQEVQPEMMSALQKRLADEYPYSLMGTHDNYGTTAVFSRTPFIDGYVLDLQAGRPAVVVRTNINRQEISFIAVHLLAYNLWWTPWKELPIDIDQKTAIQNRQVQLVLEEAKKVGGTVIVGCDCNSYETSSSVHIFDGAMDNSAREAGWVLEKNEFARTKPDTSLQHIDYVWYRGNVQPLAVYKIEEDGGSDHLPVLATFQMK